MIMTWKIEIEGKSQSCQVDKSRDCRNVTDLYLQLKSWLLKCEQLKLTTSRQHHRVYKQKNIFIHLPDDKLKCKPNDANRLNHKKWIGEIWHFVFLYFCGFYCCAEYLLNISD